jgi:hypothetical protein
MNGAPASVPMSYTGENVRVVQRRRGTGFLFEPLQSAGVGGETPGGAP